MLKLTALLLSVTLFVTGTMYAQTVNSSKENAVDLRTTIAMETEKIESDSGKIDAKKLEKIERQRQPQRNNWNGKKTLIIVTIAALVGLAVVLALTTKRCIKRSPSGCNFAEDINCECLEYAE